MTGYVPDHETGAPLCPDCAVGQCRPDEYGCWAQWCQCMCRATAVRAAELDDRPADKLHVVATELERERRGDLRDLTAERFSRGAA